MLFMWFLTALLGSLFVIQLHFILKKKLALKYTIALCELKDRNNECT